MNLAETLTSRNAAFAVDRFDAGLRMMPSLRTIVIGCVDPRVDPTDVLGTEPGEVAALRNVGGRVTPAALDELVMLRGVTRAAGGDLGAGWEVVVLHHTDCGITRLVDETQQLAAYLGVSTDRVADLAVADPWAAVVLDVATLRADTRLGEGLRVSGVVYDVLDGRVTTVVPG